MPRAYDAKDTKPSGGGRAEPIPAGAYRLKVVDFKEGKSKRDDYQVVVTFRVVGGQYNLRRIPFHYVTFFSDPEADGAGIALAFLKAVGQPHQGKFTIDPAKWVGAEVLADVTEEDYKGELSNKVKNVEAAPKAVESPADGIEEAPMAHNSKPDEKEQPLEEVPF